MGKYSHASLLIFIVYFFLWFILLVIVTVNKTDAKPKYKHKKEYVFVEPVDWVNDSTMNDNKKEFLEHLNR